MFTEWSKTLTVEEDGKLEIRLPELEKGQRVEVVVKPAVDRRAAYGMFRGKVFMSEDFDEPLEEFEDYMP